LGRKFSVTLSMASKNVPPMQSSAFKYGSQGCLAFSCRHGRPCLVWQNALAGWQTV
jgi:hypothetical protein